MQLQENSLAPDFILPSDCGLTISLTLLRGKPVVLYFYPKDNTSGCTTEACDFRDSLSDFSSLNVTVLGVSRDNLKKHKSFREKHQLAFPLLSDVDGTVCENYGVWIEKSMYGRKYFGIDRSTFLIDSEGIIRKIWRKVKVPGHVSDILKMIKTLNTE